MVVPSQANAEAFSAAGLPVSVVPYPVLPPPEKTRLVSEVADLPSECYVFYSILTWQERKNPTGLLTAFATAFTAEDPVALVVKISGGQTAATRDRVQFLYWDLVRAWNLRSPPRILLLCGEWPQENLWGLHERGDCYVRLAHGEGLGLPLMDAYAMGNEILATDWGGYTELVGDKAGVTLIPYRMTPVVQAYPHFDATQVWADPDLRSARDFMRFLANRGRRAKHDRDLSAWSLEATAGALHEVIPKMNGY